MGNFNENLDIVARNVDGSYKIINSFDGLDFNKAVCLCFGGNATTKASIASKLIRVVENGIGLKNDSGCVGSCDDVDVLSVVYPVNGFFESGELSKAQRFEIASNFFLNRVIDDNGKRLGFDEACRNMSRVTLFSHCHGAFEVEKIVDIFHELMLTKGYSPNEATKLLQNVWHISYAPDYPNIFTDKEKKIKTISFCSLKDGLLGDYYKEMYGKRLNGIDIILDGDQIKRSNLDELLKVIESGGYIDANSPLFNADWSVVKTESDGVNNNHSQLKVISSGLLNNKPLVVSLDDSVRNDEHEFGLLKRSEDDWKLIPRRFEVEGIQIKKYSPNCDCVSMMLFHSLAFSIASSIWSKNGEDELLPTKNLETLRDDLEFIRAGFSDELARY